MLVKELIDHLLKLDPELPVYTAKDEEGNGYNDLFFAPSEELAQIDGREVSVIHPDDIEEVKAEMEEYGFPSPPLTRIVVI